ncbi:MAG: SBBP repeat-containing protein, partial [bacterium]|nr:SBBP repeat-containing protein [bacterium]
GRIYLQKIKFPPPSGTVPTNSTNFPTTFAAFDTSGNGSNDIFITKLNSYGATLLYSTYLGGNGSDIGCDIAVDATGNAYITGYTTSFNFPTSATPFDNTYNGDYDGFVNKLWLVRPTAVEIPCWLLYD